MSTIKLKTGTHTVDKNIQQYLKCIGFSLGKVIGQGTYSKVFLATDANLKLACKIINRKKAAKDFIENFLPRELQILENLKHPNIVTIHRVIDIDNIVYIFMDYCKYGDLLEYIKNHGPLGETKAKLFFKQIVSAVEYLHKQDIAHRDLKCENVLLTSTTKIKLCDFGFARWTKTDFDQIILSDTFCGSAAYAAPEIMQGILYEPKIIDIWAIGCILYIMLSASMPFDDTNVVSMIKTQQERTVINNIRDNWHFVSSPLKLLLAKMLEPETEERATIEGVKNSIWLMSDNIPKLDKPSKPKSLSMLHVMM